jgi:hypothetical protein
MDTLSYRLLHETQTQIEKLTKDIRNCVAEIEAWNRESWKSEVRAKVLTRISSYRAGTGDERTEPDLVIRKAFEQALPKGTWYPQLVQEILIEDRSSSSVERMEKIIASLAVPQFAISKQDEVPQRRSELLDAVLNVCRAAEQIGKCEEALVENEHALEKRRLSFLQRVRRWFRKSLGRQDDRSYDIKYRPSSTAETKSETIGFLRFLSEMKELKALLGEITEAGSPGYRRIEAMNEEGLCDFLGWQLRQLRQIHRRMEGLNALFQVKSAHKRQAAARSIKIDLLAIENDIIRAEKVRRDSIACVEKQKQQIP